MRKIGPVHRETALAEPALTADLATLDWSKVPVAAVGNELGSIGAPGSVFSRQRGRCAQIPWSSRAQR